MQGGKASVKHFSIIVSLSSDPTRFSTQWVWYQVGPFTEGLCVDIPTSLVQGSYECAQAPILVGGDGSMDSSDKKAWFEAWLCHLLALGPGTTYNF